MRSQSNLQFLGSLKEALFYSLLYTTLVQHCTWRRWRRRGSRNYLTTPHIKSLTFVRAPARVRLESHPSLSLSLPLPPPPSSFIPGPGRFPWSIGAAVALPADYDHSCTRQCNAAVSVLSGMISNDGANHSFVGRRRAAARLLRRRCGSGAAAAGEEKASAAPSRCNSRTFTHTRTLPRIHSNQSSSSSRNKSA